jgi:hypothetical protein
MTFVESQAMKNRFGDRDRQTILLAGLLSGAAIRDDRIHKLWGPGVRNTEWITWLYSK